ncbi:MAG: hypothetical protein M3004_14475, partial [Bacteroidota bacterium]|nr:hypothetical protein [Bacteroidota bacterium]
MKKQLLFSICIVLVQYTIAQNAPSATTKPATNITSTTVTVNGLVNDNGATTTVSFDGGTDPSLVSSTNFPATTGGTINANSGPTAVSFTASGLTPNTTY